MAEKHEAAVWPERLAVQIGARVRQLRERPEWRLSAQALADRTAELGHELKRSVIANIESGRRANVTVADLIVLAAALRVPPAMLVLPIGDDAKAEVLPDRWADTVDAMQWFNGATVKSLIPAASIDEASAEQASMDIYYRYVKHGMLTTQIEMYGEWLRRDPADETLRASIGNARRELAELRAELAAQGHSLPVLPVGERAIGGNRG